MGSDAYVYVFDHGRYTSDVVPALRTLLLSGELAPWIRPRPGHTFHPGLFRDTDLLRYCTYLTADLAPQDFVAVSKTPRPHLQGWETRACLSEECPATSSCPFHQSMLQTTVEEIHDVIVTAVVSRCLDTAPLHGLFVGRTMNAADYTELLDHFAVSADHSVRALLQKLSVRGFVIGYQWTLDGDGIHGWLDPQETRQLLGDLRQLPLPNYPVTLDSVQSLLKESQAEGEVFRKDEEIRKRIVFHKEPGSTVQHGYYAPEDQERVDKLDKLGRDWLALSLSFVRTVATNSTSRRQGPSLGQCSPRIGLLGSLQSGNEMHLQLRHSWLTNSLTQVVCTLVTLQVRKRSSHSKRRGAPPCIGARKTVNSYQRLLR